MAHPRPNRVCITLSHRWGQGHCRTTLAQRRLSHPLRPLRESGGKPILRWVAQRGTRRCATVRAAPL